MIIHSGCCLRPSYYRVHSAKGCDFCGRGCMAATASDNCNASKDYLLRRFLVQPLFPRSQGIRNNAVSSFPFLFYPLHPFLEQHREFFGRKMSISRRVSKYLYHNDSFDYWYLAWNKFLNSKVFQIYNCEFLLLKIMKLD